MSVFYINNEKDKEGAEYKDKYDLAKFIDGRSDTPAETKQRIRIAISKESNL